jgi:predicted acetyltransferase
VTCDEDNAGSIRIIEANGGLFERLTATDNQRVRVPMRRYWIDLRRH